MHRDIRGIPAHDADIVNKLVVQGHTRSGTSATPVTLDRSWFRTLIRLSLQFLHP